MQQDAQIKEELTKITAYLQDTGFALSMAKHQEAAYYIAAGQPVPEFFSPGADSSVKRYVKEEKIAINAAAFYALECGIGELMRQKGGTPLNWLQKIIYKQLDTAETLVLNRFANATWKAGQPFRDLQRISRSNFISSVLLPDDEIKKDADQILAAAEKLFSIMDTVKETSKEEQLQKISTLLRDKQFSLDMAKHMEAAYYTALQQAVPPFLQPGEDSAVKKKSAKEEKIATNLAGFYALECGLGYLVTARHQLPSSVLRAIINDTLSKDDKQLFERFANATWKAGQAFKGLDRIKRDTFTSFDLLPEHEVEKDWVQIKAAAEKLLQAMQ